MPSSNTLVGRRYFAAARALCSAMAIEPSWAPSIRSEEHTSELQSLTKLVCRLLLEKKNASSKVICESLGWRRSTGKLLVCQASYARSGSLIRVSRESSTSDKAVPATRQTFSHSCP